MDKKGSMERGSVNMSMIFELIAWALQDQSVEFVTILIDRGDQASQVMSMPSEKRQGTPLPLHEIHAGFMKAMEVVELNMGVDKSDAPN